ncbi:hypothetical protein [Vulcanisaeta sp. JCM 14467]|uniref:hypothetical protein n=1 Tax=Vulcanisaeta sp. JCM 14467 TaxID=1295370 RepID=UPI0020931814|nr:hypothetical protein [Vulcanisaeta sp. JCM 14467]
MPSSLSLDALTHVYVLPLSTNRSRSMHLVGSLGLQILTLAVVLPITDCYGLEVNKVSSTAIPVAPSAVLQWA